jgi:hypothetical protein
MNPDEMFFRKQSLKMPKRSGIEFLLAVLEMNEGIIGKPFEHNNAMRRNLDFPFLINYQKMDFGGHKVFLHGGN